MDLDWELGCNKHIGTIGGLGSHYDVTQRLMGYGHIFRVSYLDRLHNEMGLLS